MIRPMRMGMLLLALGGAYWLGDQRGVDRGRQAQNATWIALEDYRNKGRTEAYDDCRAALSVMGAIHMSMQEYDWPNEKPTEVCKVRFNRTDGTPVTYAMPPAWKHNQRRFDPNAKCSW